MSKTTYQVVQADAFAHDHMEGDFESFSAAADHAQSLSADRSNVICGPARVIGPTGEVCCIYVGGHFGHAPLGARRGDALMSIGNYDDNYDGPKDGEAWSGGFAESH